MKCGTFLGTTSNRLLFPEQHIPYNKEVQSSFAAAVPTATITEYIDGIPACTEPLHIVKYDKALPTKMYYYSVGTTSGLNHWTLHRRPEYTRLHTSGYYEYNAWCTLESALNWTRYLEASCYNSVPREHAT